MAIPRSATIALAGALTAALALSAAPLVAQDATAPIAATAGRPGPDASIRLDFGAGRTVKIDCGDTAIDACITAATPLIDKVAATPAVEGWHGGKARMMGHGKGKPWMDGHGGKGHGKGKGRDGDRVMGADAPPPPAPEGEAPPVTP